MTFFSARQLQDLHQRSGGNGRLVLPYRARLTPAAQDWIRVRKIQLGYDDAQAAPATDGAPAINGPAEASSGAAVGAGTYLWWCEGPCGPAKAAVTALEKEISLRPIDLPSDARQTVKAVKALAAAVKGKRAAGGLLFVPIAAGAVIYANRCPSLRAVVGSSLDAVEQGIRSFAANVLVIEYPRQSLQPMKNMLARFLRATRDLPADLSRDLQELASCG